MFTSSSVLSFPPWRSFYGSGGFAKVSLGAGIAGWLDMYDHLARPGSRPGRPQQPRGAGWHRRAGAASRPDSVDQGAPPGGGTPGGRRLWYFALASLNFWVETS